MTEADALALLAEVIREADDDDTEGFAEIRTFGGNGHGLPRT